MPEINDHVPTNEQEAESLLEGINQPAETETTPVEKTTEQMTPQEYAFKVGGKEIKAPIDKIIRWAEMGYDAPNKIGSLQKEIDSWKQKENQFKEIEGKYGTVDQYVRENPQWWQFVQSQYEQQQKQMTSDNPMMSTINELKEKLNDISSFKDQILKEKQEMKAMQDDDAYTKEFESVKSQYPNIDLVTPDETGKTLEYKILEYASQNGIKKFTTAFRDMMHDQLMGLKEEQAKEKLMSDRVSKTKLGILGTSPTPKTKGVEYSKGKSYADLEREVLESYGIN